MESMGSSSRFAFPLFFWMCRLDEESDGGKKLADFSLFRTIFS